MVRFHRCRLLGLLVSLLAAVHAAAEDVPYSVGAWSETLGNHRARIQVMEKAEAVWLHLPWRRHDRDVEKQDILIVDSATGKRIENVARVRIGRESADLVFQPATAPGEYFVYYAPFKIQPGSGWYGGDYLPPKATAAPAWLKRHGLTAEKIAAADASKFPQAKVLAFQARSEFERSDPMEVVAAREEMKKLLTDHPTPYLVFAEDRGRPIRLDDALPLRWIRSGPVHELRGEAERNEYYAFQIGVYAAEKALDGIAVEFTDLRSPEGGVIPAARLSCINLSGNDYLGQPFHPTVSVPQGKVQALWCGVDIPRDAAPGEYEGVATVRAKNAEPTPVRLRLSIADRIREDRGDNEPTRYSRIRWLNSTLGINDEPVAPYTSLVIEDQTIRCLGREVELAPTGLPAQIRCGQREKGTVPESKGGQSPFPGRELLAAPLRFVVETADGAHAIASGQLKFVKRAAGRVEWESQGTAGPLAVQCRAEMEFDGRLGFTLTCRARQAVEVKDVRLELPVRRQAAAYFMGIGHKGGLRPKEWAWKWGGPILYDSFWIGDVRGGVQCELRGASYCGPMLNLYRPEPPASWSNGGRGGCTLSEDGETVLMRAYCGPRRIGPGRPLRFEFALLPTPVKPLDTATHFRERYYHGYDSAATAARAGANVINIHHATPLNPYINYPFLATERLRAYVKAAHQRGIKLKIYYTVRELTNHVTEMWALRSLGHEVLASGAGGGYPWLREHLAADYAPAWYDNLEGREIPAWRGPTPAGGVSAALLTSGNSRWFNYYVEGLRWLVENVEIDGLYLDDVSYGRETLKRMRRVMARRPGCLLDLHSCEGFSHQPANQYLEFFPYVDRLWFGEMFNYDESPDYWLIEISGIPYGLMGDMLQNGGNKWRGMVYGMTARAPWCNDALAMWPVWDGFDIAESRMIGYWEQDCPVRTGSPDVLATAYVRPGKTLVAVASWAKAPVECRLKIDWASLALDPAKTVLTAPEVKDFQPARRFAPTEAIPVAPGRGWVLIAGEK